MVKLLEKSDYKTMTKDELKEYKKELMTEIFNVRNALASLKEKRDDMLFIGKYTATEMRDTENGIRRMKSELEALRNTYEDVKVYLIDVYEAY